MEFQKHSRCGKERIKALQQRRTSLRGRTLRVRMYKKKNEIE